MDLYGGGGLHRTDIFPCVGSSHTIRSLQDEQSVCHMMGADCRAVCGVIGGEWCVCVPMEEGDRPICDRR